MATRTLTAPSGHGFGDGQLVQVARIVVVDGAPEEVPEIARRLLGPRRRPVDGVELGERLGREIRDEPSLEHRPVGDPSQDGAVLPVVRGRHCVSPRFWNASSLAEPPNEPGLHHLRQHRVAEQHGGQEQPVPRRERNKSGVPASGDTVRQAPAATMMRDVMISGRLARLSMKGILVVRMT